MSFFKNIFSENNSGDADSLWKKIESEEELQAAKQESYERRVVIFKHSTRCGISRMVLKNLQNEMALDRRGASFYFLDLLKFRMLSNKIAHDFGVQHQSPQMIVLADGNAIAHASHNEVSTAII